jgi:hypothetical protein
LENGFVEEEKEHSKSSTNKVLVCLVIILR